MEEAQPDIPGNEPAEQTQQEVELPADSNEKASTEVTAATATGPTTDGMMHKEDEAEPNHAAQGKNGTEPDEVRTTKLKDSVGSFVDLHSGDGLEEELMIRVPLEVTLASSCTFVDLRSSVASKLEKVGLKPIASVATMLISTAGQALNSSATDESVATLVPGSVVALVQDAAEALEVGASGLCLSIAQQQAMAAMLQPRTIGRPAPTPVPRPIPPRPFPVPPMLGAAVAAPLLPGGAQAWPRPPTGVMGPQAQQPPIRWPAPAIPQPAPRGMLYKTRMCMNYDKVQGCAFGLRCSFAHGAHELRKGPPGQTNKPVAADNEKEDSDNWDHKWRWSSNSWEDNDDSWGRSWGSRWKESSSWWDDDKRWDKQADGWQTGWSSWYNEDESKDREWSHSSWKEETQTDGAWPTLKQKEKDVDVRERSAARDCSRSRGEESPLRRKRVSKSPPPPPAPKKDSSPERPTRRRDRSRSRHEASGRTAHGHHSRQEKPRKAPRAHRSRSRRGKAHTSEESGSPSPEKKRRRR